MQQYSIFTHKRVDKFLEKHRDVAIEFVKALEVMRVHVFDPSLDIIKLTGHWDTHYRLRISKYRFLFEIIDERVLIYFYDAGSRGKIYK